MEGDGWLRDGRTVQERKYKQHLPLSYFKTLGAGTGRESKHDLSHERPTTAQPTELTGWRGIRKARNVPRIGNWKCNAKP
jgi:hypothetical protein